MSAGVDFPALYCPDGRYFQQVSQCPCLAAESVSSFTEVKVKLFLCAQVNHLSIAHVEPGKIKIVSELVIHTYIDQTDTYICRLHSATNPWSSHMYKARLSQQPMTTTRFVAIPLASKRCLIHFRFLKISGEKASSHRDDSAAYTKCRPAESREMLE